MFLSDKERISTFLIGIVLGCLIVAGLLQRRNDRLNEHDSIRNAPVPEWAEPLPEPPTVPDALQFGKILEFQKGEDGKSRSWILQYEKNYPFVLIKEDSSNNPPSYKFIAADTIKTTPKPGVRYQEYRDQLKDLNLFPREHFKKQNVIIVGIHQEKPSIESLYKSLESLQSHPIIQSAELDFIEIREPDESRFQLPGQFMKRKPKSPKSTSPTGS
jgi:hypothetical protein